MVKKKTTSKEVTPSSVSKGTELGGKNKDSQAAECSDKLCPFHGSKPLKMRGRTFKGKVIRKFHGRVTIGFQRILKVPKYESYEKRGTKIHARLPACMDNGVAVGDLIEIAETRPISKTIHFVVKKIIRKNEGAKK